jgi:hypothetical protein
MPLALAVLLFGAGVPLLAQSTPSGSLTGKLTDLHSAPLAGATVVLRNRATGDEAHTTTSRDGSYRFAALAAGEYTLEADSGQRGHGRLNGILVSAGHEARVQTAMRFDHAPTAAVQSVFLANTRTSRPPTVLLNAALPATQPAETRLPLPFPAPALVHEPPPAETPVLTATLQPTPRHPILFAALPTTALPKPDPAFVLPPPAEAPVPNLRQSAGQQVAAIKPMVLAPIPSSASLASVLHADPASPNLAIGASIANGLRAAAQWSLPHPSRIQTAAEKPDPASSAVTTTLSAAEMQSLPASGRRWEDFVLDTPAAAAPAGSSQVSLRGADQQQADTSIDGASTQLAFGGTSGSSTASPGQTRSGQEVPEPQGIGQVWSGGRYSISEAAVSSVETVAGNVEAGGARASGGRINVQTRRGSNGFHGQSFVFDRQNTWGARNPFTQWVQQTAPATSTTVPIFTAAPFTPPDHESTVGLGIGSQIRRDKLFWFAALDSLHRNDPALSTVKWPGNFFAQPANDQMQLLGAQLGTTTNTALAKYSQMLQQLDGLLGPAPRTAAQWSGFVRLDWKAAERHRFTLEATGANWNSPGGGLTRVLETYGNHSLGSSQASKQWLLARWEAFLTPNLLATTQVSAGRTIHSAHAETPSTFEQTLDQNVWGQLPQIVIDSRYGFTIGNPSRFGQGNYPDERLFRVQQSVNWVNDKLLVKAGIDAGHNADATGLLRNQTGTYYYSSVENFASDALAFASYGFSDALDKFNPHNCDQTGKVWRDSTGQLRGLGNLPCYSSYSQVMGPTNWHLSTNDWAGYATAQWQPNKTVVLAAGMRWEHEQSPPPIAALANPELPLTGKLPGLGNNWGPRVSLAIGGSERRWPVISLGYGMYYGRTSNATLENVITRTGSLNGDLNFFMRPTDNLQAGGAPPFPYVFAGEPYNLVKPGAVEFAPNFRNSEIHQAVAAVEESLPGHIQVTASALLSLGRRLPVTIDTNLAPLTPLDTITYAVVDSTGKGPIKAAQITVPFYATWPSSITGTAATGRLNPDYQQIAEIFSRANSTYEAAMVKVVRYGRRGLSLHAHYTYAHAMDWNPNESSQVMGSNILDPADPSLEYGVSNLDVRHSAAAMVILTSPWKLHNLTGKLGNGWMVSGIGQFRSGVPYTMRTSGSLPKEFNQTNGDAIAGLGPGMNGSGGDNRVYGLGSDKVVYNIGRNTYRYPYVWKADLRLSKQFDLGAFRQLQLLAESFNLFNHQNVTELETNGYYISPGSLTGSFPTLNFLTGLKANTTAFGQPLNINSTNFYRERQIQLGFRMRF